MSSKPAIVVALLLVFPPVGLILLWFFTDWPKYVKLFLTFPILIAISYFIGIQTNQTLGTSMRPNVDSNQKVIVEKFSYTIGFPQRGDLAVFRNPKDKEIEYVRRVIALPGEKIKFNGGKVYINNVELKEDYILKPNSSFPRQYPAYEGLDYTLPDDGFYVLADNREEGKDSREWGFIRYEYMVGRVWFKYKF